MVERPTPPITQPERGRIVFGPHAKVLDALRGNTRTADVAPVAPYHRETVRLAVDGDSSMMGLTDPWENREWSGLFNHTTKLAGVARTLGRLLHLNGHEFDEQLVMDKVTVSHIGSRPKNEATRYPYAMTDLTKIDKTDKEIGMEVLKRKNFSDAFLETCNIHGSTTIESTATWTEKLQEYLDQRITQTTVSLDERFTGHRANKRAPVELLDRLENWARRTEAELFDALRIVDYDTLVSNSGNMLARTKLAIKLGKFTEDETEAIKGTTEFTDQRNWHEPNARLDIATSANIPPERYLEAIQLAPEDINEKMTQPDRWEKYMRRLYLNDAEEATFKLYAEMERQRDAGVITQEDIDREVPPNTWWGSSMRALFEQQNGIPQRPATRNDGEKPLGTAREIDLFTRREEGHFDAKAA
jgi:hypothetical protein